MYLTASPTPAPLALQLSVTRNPPATPPARGAVAVVYDRDRQVSVMPDGTPQTETTSAITMTSRPNEDIGVPNESESQDLW
ncbi:putative ATP-grasp-modified RiPP [Streptomyces sp. MAR4 CNX-425]|uniref:putative ATP-grasp-modified RiPP n=1 Tax=Streptomyces sp. MAR4 CNX-425 TaxID=3406343 RepID=UPI003B50E4BA